MTGSLLHRFCSIRQRPRFGNPLLCRVFAVRRGFCGNRAKGPADAARRGRAAKPIPAGPPHRRLQPVSRLPGADASYRSHSGRRFPGHTGYDPMPKAIRLSFLPGTKSSPASQSALHCATAPLRAIRPLYRSSGNRSPFIPVLPFLLFLCSFCST